MRCEQFWELLTIEPDDDAELQICSQLVIGHIIQCDLCAHLLQRPDGAVRLAEAFIRGRRLTFDRAVELLTRL